MSAPVEDPEALARRVRNLRRLAGRVDPERFACTVDDVADGVARLAWTNAVHCAATRAKAERPAAANGTATNERRLLALVRAQARDIDELRRLLATARQSPPRCLRGDDRQLGLALHGHGRG